jgi:hypothetical protein
MKLPTLRVQHGLLCAVLAASFFAWGAWLMRPSAPAEPLPWLATWQSQVLPVLASEKLSLGKLRAAEPSQARGELWLQSQPSGARLLYRSVLGGSDDAWALAAVLELGAGERDSLVAAAGFQSGDSEQPLSPQLLEQLASFPVHELELTPVSAPMAERLVTTLGQPRVRLQLEGGEAWVYPALGLTARVQDDTLLQLRAAPN